MDAIAEIRRRLERYPQAPVAEGRGWIRVEPVDADGFPAQFEVDGRGATVFFAGWHEHFSDIEEALVCFAFGLSVDARLRVELRGTMATKWVLEYFKGGEWLEDSETGLLLFPFWRAKTVRYLRNRLLRSSVVPPPP